MLFLFKFAPIEIKSFYYIMCLLSVCYKGCSIFPSFFFARSIHLINVSFDFFLHLNIILFFFVPKRRKCYVCIRKSRIQFVGKNPFHSHLLKITLFSTELFRIPLFHWFEWINPSFVISQTWIKEKIDFLYDMVKDNTINDPSKSKTSKIFWSDFPKAIFFNVILDEKMKILLAFIEEKKNKMVIDWRSLVIYSIRFLWDRKDLNSKIKLFIDLCAYTKKLRWIIK